MSLSTAGSTASAMSHVLAGAALNQAAGDSYTHAPEPACRSVRYAHENSGVQGRRAHSARYPGRTNLMHLGLEEAGEVCVWDISV
ncbi:MAG: hypothetical protein HY268_20530 [Deltaproteobacteria bacterium]|nr:hypothetical protein [Deltaproteobacteria bacterium]